MMKAYDVICGHCGNINRGLLLEETDGWMECNACLATIHIELSFGEALEDGTEKAKPFNTAA